MSKSVQVKQPATSGSKEAPAIPGFSFGGVIFKSLKDLQSGDGFIPSEQELIAKGKITPATPPTAPAEKPQQKA